MTQRMMTRFGISCRRCAVIAVASLLAGASTFARAQQGSGALAQLSEPARAAIRAAADSLDAEHLPGEALVAKAAEGLLKGADEARILSAVRRLSVELRTAGGALGSGARESEVVAAATALHAGASPDVLRQLRALAPAGREGAGLTVPLVVLTDLVARGTPVRVAGESVKALLARHASDADLQALRVGVERDIFAGDDPATAALARSRALADSLGGRAGSRRDPGHSTRPLAPLP